MSEATNHPTPWDSETSLFETPNANCELVLDGRVRAVSIIVWEDYCYLKVAGLNGLWAITRAYDETDLVSFVETQIEAGEVGRVWCFNYAFRRIDYLTRQYIDTNGKLPQYIDQSLPVVAVVRFDNSALFRRASKGPFYETPPFVPAKRRPGKNKAHIPSIWHPGRQLIGYQRIASQARLVAYPPLAIEELFPWKKGSLPEAVTLLETLYFFASKDKERYRLGRPMNLHWPVAREQLVFSVSANQRKLVGFMQIIWDHHHFDTNSWLPVGGIHHSVVTDKRHEWRNAFDHQHLTLSRHILTSAHEQVEAALRLHDFFKGKVSDEELDELLIDSS